MKYCKLKYKQNIKCMNIFIQWTTKGFECKRENKRKSNYKNQSRSHNICLPLLEHLAALYLRDCRRLKGSTHQAKLSVHPEMTEHIQQQISSPGIGNEHWFALADRTVTMHFLRLEPDQTIKVVIVMPCER